jgi:glycosyltransferase involved in cell wall biosynthesis
LKDEEGSVEELTGEIIEAAKKITNPYEIIFIDDGSTDSSWEKVTSLISLISTCKAEDNKNLVCISALRFRRNMGKAHALAEGFRLATGDIVITMDADLQDVPEEIPKFLDKLAEGYDLVVGWKKERKDSLIKIISSRIFNGVANFFSGLSLYDHNCGFKCFRKQALNRLVLYGDMHRMIPSLVAARGFKITELAVEHREREHGKSKYGKYGFGRAVGSFFDLFTVWFLRNFYDRPAHLFGPLAVFLIVPGCIILFSGLYKDFILGQGYHIPLVGPLIIIAGFGVGCIGLLAELLVYSFVRDDKFPLPVAEYVSQQYATERANSSETAKTPDSENTQ